MRRFGVMLLISAALGESPAASRSSWPGPTAELESRAPEFSAEFGVRRIFVDAGHGSENNPGNRSAFCVDEQDFTLELSNEVARRLAETGHFEVRVSRQSGAVVPYPERVRDAENWRADAFISLHSDVRGHASVWSPSADLHCLRSHDAPGFSVLWSDYADRSLVERRRALGERVSSELAGAGFFPFDGVGYQPAYSADPSRAGCFVDRHAEAERIYVLWRPSMPSLIVETHNALDDREALRWKEPSTRRAFANALSRALSTALAH